MTQTSDLPLPTVLRLLADGLDTAEIASRLGAAGETARSQQGLLDDTGK